MNKKDLGTLISYDAEMYKNNINLEKKEKYYTFQQQVAANEGRCAPSLPSAAPAAPGVRGKPKTSKSVVGNTPFVQNTNMLSKDDVYYSIAVQMGKIKIGQRVNRADIYPNLMRDIDSVYKIKLTCKLTDELNEIKKGAIERVDKRSGKFIPENRYILNLVEEYKNKNIDGLMLGRLRYRPEKNFVSDFNRQNIPYALCVLYPNNDNTFTCILHLYMEMYTIILTNDITEKQKEVGYVLSGTYTGDLPDLEDTL
jgi:hypothetical protein